MSDRALGRAGRGIAATAVVLSTGSLALALATREVTFWWRSFAGVEAAVALAFGIFVWLIIARRPRNAAVWAMAASIGAAIDAFTLALIAVLTAGDPLDILTDDWVPADSPAAVGWVRLVGALASVPGLFVPLTLGLMLFPDGVLPSKRWRPLAVAATAGITVLAVSHAWGFRPDNASRHQGPQIVGAVLVCVAVAAVSVGSLVGRFRRSSGVSRLQYKWIVCGTAIGAAGFFGAFFVPDSAIDNGAVILVIAVAAVCWVVSCGIAIGRYRLYEIDVVISRTFVYASLAVLITGTYVVVVVAVGSLVGGSELWLSVLATAVVAIGFEPARTRLQRWANQLVYGRRATPYEILGDLTGRLAVSERPDALLRRLADQLCSGTGARRVVVWLAEGGTLRPVAVAPPSAADLAPVVDVAGLPGRNFPMEHEGEVLGHLTVDEDPGMSLRPSHERLAEDLAGSAALVVRALGLDRALASKAAETEESRRRLVGAQDDELRRLERELSSSVELQVMALKARVGLVERVALDEGSERTAALVSGLRDDAQDAIEQIRSLARGIYPPLLDADGLEVAVASLAALCPEEVAVETDLGGRHPTAHEGAVYFCISEAFTNASKHGHGPLSVRVTDRNAELAFTVADSGPGFDVDRIAAGSGLHNMTDRMEALGGHLRVTSRPGAITTIAGVLPVAVPAVT